MSESEVASYVLAYLLRQSYSQTARSFLKECNVLPSKALVVLPQIPLETVIARHKSVSDSRVMVSTLGESSAWAALWNKLDTTLQQIRCLSEELVAKPSTTTGSVGVRSRATGRRAAKTIGSTSVHASPVTSDPKQLSSSQVQSSPHRRKHVPKRKVLARTPESAESAQVPPETPPSPTMEQLLDTFLGDNTLPGKLADIINQCVSSGPDVSSGELTSDTLDNILNMTCSEPVLGNLITTASHDDDITASNVDHVIPCEEPTVDHVTESGPAQKRPKLESDDVPSEQDIDDFLDQLHKQ